MNELIEKLGEEADLLGEFTPTKIPGRYVGYITEEQILKFTELIIRECMLLSVIQSEASYVSNYIAKHFGIKP
jgi:hypothetical protein